MSKDIVKVLGFCKSYSNLNLKLFKEDRKSYDAGIIIVHGMELEAGMIVRKINKPTKEGTNVYYKSCNNEEEAEAALDKVQNLIHKYIEDNKK